MDVFQSLNIERSFLISPALFTLKSQRLLQTLDISIPL